MTRDDVPLGKGQCDIRLQVDNEAEVSVRGDTVFVRTVLGRDARDDGSECNDPVPGRNLEGFNFQVTESRGEIRLLSEPSPRNNFATVVRIRDSSGGEGRYTFRITWDMTGSGIRRPGAIDRNPGGFDRNPGFPPDDNPGRGRGRGLNWNNTIRFSGVGRGSSMLTSYGSQRLTLATVNIDRGGNIAISFRGETERPLSFTGTVVASEGGRYRADVITEDRRMRGAMFITIDGRDEIDSINFEGTDGPNRLVVNWDRR